MDNTIAVLKKYIEKNKTEIKFERGLIFLNVLDHIDILIPNKKKVVMIYAFSKIQKSFLQLKKNRYHESRKNDLKQIDKLYDSLEANIRFNLSLVYLPMRAYYYYSIYNFEMAIQDLECCIENSNVILKGNLELETLLKTEQILNLFKVYFQSKDFKKANNLAVELIQYSIYNKESNLLKQYDVRNINNSFYWISHIVESIFLKYLEEDNLKELINQIDSKRNEKTNLVFHLSFYFFKLYYSENYEEAEECALELLKLPVQNTLPDIMFCTILSKLEIVLMKVDKYNYKNCRHIIHRCIKNKTQDKKYIRQVLLKMN